MAGEVMLGAQVAASIISIARAVNDLKEGKVGVWGRKKQYIAMSQEVANLKAKIPEMIEENEKLLGYKELHKDAQEFLNVANNLGKFIRNAYTDNSRVLDHIEDLHDSIIREAHPLRNSVIYIAEQIYPFLNKDKNVTIYLSPISQTLTKMHSLVESAWINKSHELDKNGEVERYWAEIVENLTDLMRYLDKAIMELSTKIKEESKAFENRLKESERGEKNGSGH